MNQEQNDDDANCDGLYQIEEAKIKNNFSNIGFPAKLKVQPQQFIILDNSAQFESDYILNRANIFKCINDEVRKYNVKDITTDIILNFMYKKEYKLKYEIKFIHQQIDRHDYDNKWLFAMEITISSADNNHRLYCLRFDKSIDEEINKKIYPIKYEDDFDASYPQCIYLKSFDNKIVIEWCFKNEYQSEIGRSYLICNLLYKYDVNNPYKDVQQNVFEVTKWTLYKGDKQIYNDENLYHPVYPYICGYSVGPYNMDTMDCLGIGGRFGSWGYVKWSKLCKRICTGECSEESHRGICDVDYCKQLRYWFKKYSKNADWQLNGFYPYKDNGVCWLYAIINGNEILKIVMNRGTMRLYQKAVIKGLKMSDNIDVEYNIAFLKDFWVITASNDVNHDNVYQIAGTKWIVEKDWSSAYPFVTEKNPFALLTV